MNFSVESAMSYNGEPRGEGLEPPSDLSVFFGLYIQLEDIGKIVMVYSFFVDEFSSKNHISK